MSEDKISVNEMITTCPEQYLNSHLKVTRTVVYNENVFLIISYIDHSGSNTTIENVNDNSLIGELWNFLEYNIRKDNMNVCSDVMRLGGFPI